MDAIRTSPAGLSDYDQFVRQVRALLGIDLGAYKRDQMQRRLLALAQRRNLSDLAAYGRLLRTDDVERQRFLDTFTITVSEFFRDSMRYAALEHSVMPRLLTERARLRVWSAGCANGAEAYSLAMVLGRYGPPEQHYLLATDIDATILARGRAGGPYGEREVAGVLPVRRRRYLRCDPEGRWWVQDHLRRCVRFAQHDLLRDRFAGDFDLIACRNVAIYFTDDAKDALYRRLVAALRPGGVLFVGGTEMIAPGLESALKHWGHGLYIRAGGRGWPDPRPGERGAPA